MAGGHALSCAGGAVRRRLPADRAHLPRAGAQVRQGGQGTGGDRVLDDVERGGAAEGDGSAGAARCARRIVSFVLPLGYSFNLDGSTLYLSLAAVFVAQAAGVQLTVGQQVTMLLTLMLTTKGVAGVPRASLVILAGTLASYGLPLEGITLILGVDELMDMARTMTNVVGNCLATVVIAKWEGEFVEASDADLELAAARGEI